MTAKPQPAESEALYSIGEVSALTGLSTHTVRVWERRYGRPTAVRLPSGHRRYEEDQVAWLRAVAELRADRRIWPLRVLPAEPESA